MGLIKQTATTPVLLGELRHLYMAIGTVIMSLGIVNPAWLPVIFSEGFTEVLFVLIGAAINIVQLLRSVNAPEKRVSKRVSMLGVGISPQLAGTLRQILTMFGTMLIIFKIPVPEFLINILTPEGVNMLVDIVGAIITYISFVLSRNSEEKQVSETKFAELRRSQ